MSESISRGEEDGLADRARKREEKEEERRGSFGGKFEERGRFTFWQNLPADSRS